MDEFRYIVNGDLVDKPKPFKLYFVDKKVVGKSDIEIDKPLRLAPTVAPKFYTKTEADVVTQENKVAVEKKLKVLNVKGPKEKYRYPKTENQRYGWYELKLKDVDLSDRRLNFAKRSNPLIKEHLMNYAKIRD